MFEDVWLSEESRDETLKRWSMIFFSFTVHSAIIFFILFGNLIITEKNLPDLKVIDVYLSHTTPRPPVSMRAAAKETQKKTKLVKKEQNIKKIIPTSESVLIVPIEIPGEIVDEDDILVSDIDFGTGGGVEGGLEGGSEGGVLGGSILGEFVENEIEPVRIIGEAPKLIKYVKPIYPEDALKFRITGLVVIEVTVSPFGRIQKWRVLIVDGHPLFKQSAIDAIKQWVYEPYLVNGAPTPFIITATITFNRIQ